MSDSTNNSPPPTEPAPPTESEQRLEALAEFVAEVGGIEEAREILAQLSESDRAA